MVYKMVVASLVRNASAVYAFSAEMWNNEAIWNNICT